MVSIADGFYFCHAFDLGCRPAPFQDWIMRESLPIAPVALRYRQVRFEPAYLFVNELGFAVALQKIPDAESIEEAHHRYEHQFDPFYNEVRLALTGRYGSGVIGETSSVVGVGRAQLNVAWRTVELPAGGAANAILLEALFIDELCRALERRSDSFVRESSLAADRLLVEYAECLFALSTPAGFLVEAEEIDQMEIYFAAWKLGARVQSLRSRFSESVTNTALYRGHLERNRQGALNAILTGIALLSLAQVSKAICEVLERLAIVCSEAELNQLFVVVAMIVMLFGGWRYVIKPALGIWLDNIKRVYVRRLTRR